MTSRALHVRRSPAHSRRAFTLVELLVVVSIIALLIALLIGTGIAVTRGANARATTGVLSALDRALDEFQTRTGRMPPHRPQQYPVFDENGDPMTPTPPFSADMQPTRPDASIFLRQVQGVGETDAIISGLPDRFFLQKEWEEPPDPPYSSATVLLTLVLDAWENRIYYVHPDNQAPDSEDLDAQDIYGRTINNRPYFMSAGTDGFYGHPDELGLIKGQTGIEDDQKALRAAREDNLYSYEVDIDFDVPLDSAGGPPPPPDTPGPLPGP